MPKKIRELKAALRKAGFSNKPAKGSHEKWKHEQLSQKIIIAGKDGTVIQSPIWKNKCARL